MACTIAIIAVIFVVSAKGPTGPAEPGTTPNTGGLEAIKMAAGQLVDEYTANEIAADYKYKNHIIALEGKIVDVSRDPKTNKPYIAVTVRGKYSGTECIRCFFNNENELLGLTKREEVVLKGKCLGKKEDVEGTSFPILFESCSLIEETEFEIIDWHVIVNLRSPELVVSYKKFGYSLRFHLTNPQGITISTELGYVPPTTSTEGAVHLKLTEDMYENPLPGEYRLSVEATKLLLEADPSVLDTEVIASKTFDFSGPQPEMAVTDFRGAWARGTDEPYFLGEVKFRVKNTGDLPFCTMHMSASSDGRSGSYWVHPEGVYTYATVAPGEEKTLVASAEEPDWRDVLLFYDYCSGKQSLILNFVDSSGKVGYSLDTTVTIPQRPRE